MGRALRPGLSNHILGRFEGPLRPNSVFFFVSVLPAGTSLLPQNSAKRFCVLLVALGWPAFANFRFIHYKAAVGCFWSF